MKIDPDSYMEPREVECKEYLKDKPVGIYAFKDTGIDTKYPEEAIFLVVRTDDSMFSALYLDGTVSITTDKDDLCWCGTPLPELKIICD